MTPTVVFPVAPVAPTHISASGPVIAPVPEMLSPAPLLLSERITPVPVPQFPSPDVQAPLPHAPLLLPHVADAVPLQLPIAPAHAASATATIKKIAAMPLTIGFRRK